jgi:hypothetical protein
MSEDILDEFDADDDFDDVDPAEIDEVLVALQAILEKVKSETIRDYIEVTCEDLAALLEELELDEPDYGERAA